MSEYEFSNPDNVVSTISPCQMLRRPFAKDIFIRKVIGEVKIKIKEMENQNNGNRT